MSNSRVNTDDAVALLAILRSGHPELRVRTAALSALNAIEQLKRENAVFDNAGQNVCWFLRGVGVALGFDKPAENPDNKNDLMDHIVATVADAKRYRAMFDEHGLDYFDRAIGLPKAEADAFIDNAIAEEEKKGVVV